MVKRGHMLDTAALPPAGKDPLPCCSPGSAFGGIGDSGWVLQPQLAHQRWKKLEHPRCAGCTVMPRGRLGVSREGACPRSPVSTCPSPAFCDDLQQIAPLGFVPSPEPANSRPCDGSRLSKIGASFKMINVLLNKMVLGVCLTSRESSVCQGRCLRPPACGNYRAASLEVSKDCIRLGILGYKRGGLVVV